MSNFRNANKRGHGEMAKFPGNSGVPQILRHLKRRAAAATLLLQVAFALLPRQRLMAVGTPSGTDIVSQATVTYNVGPANFVINSNITTTRVVELLDLNTQWQDAAPITVHPGDTAEVTNFVVTNTGNGNDSYFLECTGRLDGDDFDPVLRGIYLDSNGNGLYDPGSDAQYLQWINDPVLDADQTSIVFILTDIPINLSDGNRGDVRLTATSTLGTGPPGTIFPGHGDFGLDAILGNAGGDDSELGSYVVANVAITLAKTVTITDMSGGNEPTTGATLSYTIAVTASGSGSARSVVVTDSIPQYTTYVAGSLMLNSISLTDEADGDAGDAGRTTPGMVTVNLGDISIPSEEQIITFDVTID